MAKTRLSNKKPQPQRERKLELDFDTADCITILNLKNSYEGMHQDLEQMIGEVERGENVEINQKDIGYNIVMLAHIKAVLGYYGEQV